MHSVLPGLSLSVFLSRAGIIIIIRARGPCATRGQPVPLLSVHGRVDSPEPFHSNICPPARSLAQAPAQPAESTRDILIDHPPSPPSRGSFHPLRAATATCTHASVVKRGSQWMFAPDISAVFRSASARNAYFRRGRSTVFRRRISRYTLLRLGLSICGRKSSTFS